MQNNKAGLIHLIGKYLVVFFILFWQIAYATTNVNIGVLTFRGQAETQKQWNPTAQWLGARAAGYNFTIVPLNVVDIDSVVANQSVDFILVNPEVLTRLKIKYSVNPMATLITAVNKRPIDKFGGVIFTTANREDITTLKDLNNKKIVSVSPLSFAGFMLQKWELNREDPDASRSLDINFVGHPQDKIVTEVLSGNADVGFVRTGVLESMAQEHKIDLKQIKIINQKQQNSFPLMLSTELYPEWAFASIKNDDNRLVRAVAKALFDISPNMPCAVSGKYYGFAPPANYSDVEALMIRIGAIPSSSDFDFSDIFKKYTTNIMLMIFLSLALIVFMVYRLYADNKKLSIQLETSERLTLRDAILDSLGEGVFGVDTEQKCIFINQAALNMLGYTKEDMLGRKIMDILLCPVFRNKTGNWILDNEVCLRCKSGESLSVRMTTNTLIDGSDDVIGAVSVFEDITQLKQTSKRLEEAMVSAEKANAIKSEFLANMSHEIRTPLNGIMGFVELLKKSTIIDQKERSYINILDRSSKGLLNIIDEILDFSKIEANMLELSPALHSPVDEYSAVVELFSSLAQEKHINLLTFIDPNLPSIAFADEIKIRQVLTNLLSNSIKFTTPNGTVTLNVRVVSREEDKCDVAISVSDTGIGMSEDDIEKLFSPFSQADTSISRSFGGTGLGLAISQKIVNLMDSEIIVKSEPGRGSEFSFVITLEQCEGRDLVLPNDVRIGFVVGNYNGDIGLVLDYLQSFGPPISIIDSSDIDIEDFDILIMHMDEIQNSHISLSKLMSKLIIISHYHTKTEPFSNMLAPPFLPKKIYGMICSVGKLKIQSQDTIVRGQDEAMRGKVLIVDDQETNRILLQEILTSYGIDSQMAEDGFEAFEMFKNFDFDIVFMDIHMPKCDGISALKLIRQYESQENFAPTKIIALSADAIKGRAEFFIESGFDSYMSKPIDYGVLMQILKENFGESNKNIVKNSEQSGIIESNYFSSSQTALELGISESSVIKSFKAFMSSMISAVPALELAIESGDKDSIKDYAHKIKGSSSNLRIPALALPARELENGAYDMAKADMDIYFGEIKNIFSKLLEPQVDGNGTK